MSSKCVVKVENISKSYNIYGAPEDRLKQMIVPKMDRLFRSEPRKYYKEFWALRNISFDVKAGETLGIIGRNGSGKSTLLQTIVGTLTPTIGKVSTAGRIAALLELGAGFNPEFTGRENAILNATILGLTPDEAEKKIDSIAEFADIGDFFDRPVKTYSSGMFVRVAFAVQASIDPDILVIDEALAVGDEKFQRKCFERLDTLREAGTAILLVTHSATTIERFCDRAVLLHQGEMHNVGPSNEIVDQYHALLYADRVAYANLRAASASSGDTAPVERTPDEISQNDSEPRAQIVTAHLLDEHNHPSESFSPGQKATIAVSLKCAAKVPELQVGMRIRTVEGVFAFGTSTFYHSCNLKNVSANETVIIRFDVELNLCEGAYFITLAAADALIAGDMRYLDKRTDVLFFRMTETRITAGGIAHLPATIHVERAN